MNTINNSIFDTIGEKIGFVLSSSSSDEILVMVYDRSSKKPILNTFLGIEYRTISDNVEKNNILIGLSYDYEIKNKLLEPSESSKYVYNLIEEDNIPDIVREQIEERSYFILKVRKLTAINIDTGTRESINSLILPGASVYKLNFFPIIKKDHFYCIGNYFNSKLSAYLSIKDFIQHQEGYHFTIVGQTGSGKSTIAKMLLSLYAKSSKDMNFFIIDPVGEFTKSFSGNISLFYNTNITLSEIWHKIGRSYKIINSENIVFDRWEMLEELFFIDENKSILFKHFKITNNENRENFVYAVIQYLKKKKIRLEDLYKDTTLLLLKNYFISEDFVNKVYSSKDSRSRLHEEINDPENMNIVLSLLKENIFRYFYKNPDVGCKTIDEYISTLLSEKGQTYIIDIPSISKNSNTLKNVLIKYVIKSLYHIAVNEYIKNRQNIHLLNTLVLFDEAHRFCPSNVYDDHKLLELSNEIRKAFIETRKFGIGWGVISTKISNLHRDLYEHSRVKIIGTGLLSGTDNRILSETFDTNTMHLYSLLPDPLDNLAPNGEKKFLFMFSGLLNIISNTYPEFIEVDHNKFLEEIYNTKVLSGVYKIKLLGNCNTLKEKLLNTIIVLNKYDTEIEIREDSKGRFCFYDKFHKISDENRSGRISALYFLREDQSMKDKGSEILFSVYRDLDTGIIKFKFDYPFDVKECKIYYYGELDYINMEARFQIIDTHKSY